MGRGFSELLSSDSTKPADGYLISWRRMHAFDAALGKRPVAAPGVSTERAEALAAGANRIIYGDFSVTGNILRATATEEDVARHKMIRVASASGPASDGLMPLANSLARQLGQTPASSVPNPQALREYATGLDSNDPAAAFGHFQQAAAADPGLGRVYVAWLDLALTQRNRAEADRAVQSAQTHWANLSELERAEIGLGGSLLRGDVQGRLAALTQLAALEPADPNEHRALAETLVSLRKYDDGIAEYRRALALSPNDIVSLNAMGYAAAYSGDLPTAIRVLRGYEQLRPNDANPLDSLGDVHYALGHYAEAEKFYMAARAKAIGPAADGEQVKAAQARLMSSDVAGATGIFNQYLQAREVAHDPMVDYHRATWMWQTGARRAAIQKMDDLARADANGPLREVTARANAQAAIWLLNLGDRQGAAERARRAAAAGIPSIAGIAALGAYLALPDTSPAEWSTRADSAFPDPAQAQLRQDAQAYALIFGKQFQPALAIVEKMYARPTNEPDDGVAVLLAWMYIQNGQWQRAQPLLRLNPLPQSSGLPLLGSLYFPRLFFLRGTVLEKQGQRDEAAQNLQFFGKLSGPDATIWGEEQQAREH